MTRLVFEHFMNKDKWLNLTFETRLSKGVLQDTKYNFMKYNKTWLSSGLIIVLICVGFLFIRALYSRIEPKY